MAAGDYHVVAHVELLAREHLDRATRRRLSSLLRVAPHLVDGDETFVLLTDAYVAGGVGLLALTDERVVFVPLSDCDDVVEVDLAETVGAFVDSGGGPDLYDVIVVSPTGTNRFEAVGDSAWANEIVATLNGGGVERSDVESDEELEPGPCQVCSAPWPANLSADSPCPSCRLATAETRPERGLSVEPVTFTLDMFTPQELAQIDADLTKRGVPHKWDGVTLVASAWFEDAIDDAIEAVGVGTSVERWHGDPPSGSERQDSGLIRPLIAAAIEERPLAVLGAGIVIVLGLFGFLANMLGGDEAATRDSICLKYDELSERLRQGNGIFDNPLFNKAGDLGDVAARYDGDVGVNVDGEMLKRIASADSTNGAELEAASRNIADLCGAPPLTTNAFFGD